jgi:hypothetical protein
MKIVDQEFFLAFAICIPLGNILGGILTSVIFNNYIHPNVIIMVVAVETCIFFGCIAGPFINEWPGFYVVLILALSF